MSKSLTPPVMKKSEPMTWIRFIYEVSVDIDQWSWVKALTLGMFSGLTFEFMMGTIEKFGMRAGIIAFWAVLFTSIAKILANLMRNYLAEKYPKYIDREKPAPEKKKDK